LRPYGGKLAEVTARLPEFPLAQGGPTMHRPSKKHSGPDETYAQHGNDRSVQIADGDRGGDKEPERAISERLEERVTLDELGPNRQSEAGRNADDPADQRAREQTRLSQAVPEHGSEENADPIDEADEQEEQ
jgi:hypothetical protein